MAVRLHLAATLLLVLAGCGGEQMSRPQVRLLAPAGIVEDVGPFERQSRCLVDLRVYDDAEDVTAIARRRNADVVAEPAPPGREPDVSVPLVRITLERGLTITIPKTLSAAFPGAAIRPAGSRSIVWTIREQGENDACARRWLDYATSQ